MGASINPRAGMTGAMIPRSVSDPLLTRLPREFANRAKEFFTYTISVAPLAAGGTGVGAMNISNDADFAWVYGTAVVTQVDNLTVPASRPITVQLADASSGSNLSDAPVHIDNLFGTAQLPFFLPIPRALRAGAQVTAALANLIGGTPYNVRLAFHGFKVYFAERR